MSKKKKELSFFLAEYDILLEELPIYGGRMLLMRGGDFIYFGSEQKSMKTDCLHKNNCLPKN